MIIYSERNHSAYLQLVELTRSGRALAFAGAGVSCPMGYPNWDRLIERLATEYRALGGEQIQSNGQVITVEQVLRDLRDEPLVQGQIIKQNVGHRYFEVMTEVFGPKENLTAPIFDLIALPFKHLLTSNYDPGLEQHHRVENRPISICLHHDSAPEFVTNFADDD